MKKRIANGILPSHSWLRDHGYNGLLIAMQRNPRFFQHLLKDKLTRSLAEQIQIADELALNNGGLLPEVSWLRGNGYTGLASAMRKYPNSFQHIQQKRLRKSCYDHVLMAEELAKNNNGVLPYQFWLLHNGYADLVDMIRTKPESFNHIKQERRRKTLEEYVLIAEDLAKRNGGVLPYSSQLDQTGHQGLRAKIRLNRKAFEHIPQRPGNHHEQSIDDHISTAKRLVRENCGVLPSLSWLRKNGFSSLAAAIGRKPDCFEDIPRMKAK